MCGIAGLINHGSSPARLDRVRPVLDRLRHRGPDDLGFLIYSGGKVERGREWEASLPSEAEVVLLHRRLSIIDLSEAGWQPKGTRDGRYYVVFNGEIYNYIELREELAALGHQFHTQSDTEVLLEAFAEWGLGALPRFVGMFALALLDVAARRVVLARDFFGIKPLYYTASGPLAFASEMKALLDFDCISRRVNPQVAFRYLRFGLCDYGPDTMLRDVVQLPPAHYLEIALDAPLRREPVCYWQPATDEIRDLSFDEAAKHLRELFLESVRFHLRSDVPIGAALSGGIDSSSIVMAMRALEPALDLNTFSFIADDPSINEERWVDLVGESARAKVHKVSATPQELVRDLDWLTCVQDQPIYSTSPYAQFRVFQRARQAGITVMIDGQGADEMLGGYVYYRAARIASLLRHHRWTEAYRLLREGSARLGASGKWILMKAVAYLLPPSLQPALRKLARHELMPAWLNRPWFEQNGVQPLAIPTTRECDVLRHTLLQEITTTSLPQLLRYEDRNSMAFSIESRVPFLTPKLASFVLSLPERFLIAEDGTSKAVFRQAMRGLVPDAILDRRDKIGFATPESGWLSALRPWADRTLHSESAAAISPINRAALAREWESVSSGRVHFSSSLWRSLNLIKWTEQFGVQYD